MKNLRPLSSAPEYLTPRDIPRFLPVGTNQAYALCRRDDFPAKKIGKKYIIPREALKKWLESNG